jgi:AcrR family transcriptional regulator
LNAVIDEICETGPARLTVDKVAERSGVAKTTIYRRWPNKNELIVDAIDVLRNAAPVPDSGDTRADLITGLDNMIRVFISPQGKAIGAVLAERAFDPRLAAVWEEKIANPHRAAFAAVLEHGAATGQIRPDVDLKLAAIVVGAVAFQLLYDVVPYRPGLAADVVNAALDGIASQVINTRGTEQC